jgi:hypothetical protein
MKVKVKITHVVTIGDTDEMVTTEKIITKSLWDKICSKEKKPGIWKSAKFVCNIEEQEQDEEVAKKPRKKKEKKEVEQVNTIENTEEHED